MTTNSTTTLNGTWQLRYGRQGTAAADMASPAIPSDFASLPAQVPGNVELDLIRAGHLPAGIERGDAIYLLRSLEKNQWWYSRTFEAVRPAAGERCNLVFEGVDTLATVWLNGHRIALLENMLIPHRIDVTDTLRNGKNELTVGIDSVVLAALDYPIPPGERSFDANWESLNIRKAAHGFGWDILPRAVTAGLWRGVRLEMPPPIRFENVYVATDSVDLAKESARLWITWDIVAPPHDDLDAWSVRLRVLDDRDAGRVVHDEEFPVCGRHALVRPQLRGIAHWWPRGYGDPRLYRVRLDILDGEKRVLAAHELRTGFRTIRLERTELLDEAGNGRFAFIVNGEEIFMKGTNWVPLDAFHSRDAGRVQQTLDLACELNCNMIRCWGGGVYEDQAFFDRCDAAGILIWQDFALACSLYPQNNGFRQKIRAEAEAVVGLLRNHPSLALWAGNNEVDLFYHVLLPHIDPNVADRTSREVLAEVCRQYDPWRDFLPSSPYFSPALHALGNPYERRPEDHLWWGPRGDFKAPYFSESRTLFVSEIGFGGIPCRRSLERMMTPEGLWPWQDNEEWLAHIGRPQRRGRQFTWRLGQLAEPVASLFGSVPDGLDDFVFAAQVAQAEALKYFIERWRIRKGHCSGLLWWNLRDGWPMIAGAVVDYYGEKSLAFHAIKRVQTDVCVMLDKAADGRHEVVAVNDTRQTVHIAARVSHAAKRLLEGEFELAANASRVLGEVPASGMPACYTINWQIGVQSFQNHYLAGQGPLELAQCRSWYREEGLCPPVSEDPQPIT